MSNDDSHRQRQFQVDIASLHLQESQVMLILGEPSPADLHALLTSYYFDLSLLVIAIHSPLDIPNAILQSPTGPDVRVLCMSKPLALDESSGSVRLVSLLERACSVVKAWRDSLQKPSPSPLPPHASSTDRKRIVHLSESTPGGEFSTAVVEPFINEHKVSRQPPSNAPTNGRRSYSCFGTTSPSTSPLHAQAQPTCTRSKTYPSHHYHRRSQSEFKPTLATSSSQRQPPFNAILNFFPVGLSEKALLKQTILVTTLCSPYLSDVEAYHYSNLNDVTREPEGDPTVRSSAPSHHRRSASSRTDSDNRRHRFSAFSFLSSTSQGSANSSTRGSKPTWARRLSHLFGNGAAAGRSPPAPRPRSDIDDETLAATGNGTTRQSTESVRLCPVPHNMHARDAKRRPNNAHLVHILPKNWVVPSEEAAAKIQIPNTPPLARHRTLTVPTANTTATGNGGGRSGSAAVLSTRERRNSMPVVSLLPASSPSSAAFVHARVQGSLLRRATLLNNAARHHHATTSIMSTKEKRFPGPHHSTSIRRELAPSSSSRDKPILAERMCQFLSDYHFAGLEKCSTTMSGSVVVPYVIASGCLGDVIPGISRLALEDRLGDDNVERKLTVSEVVLLGAVDLAYCGRRSERNCCWIGGVDDLGAVCSESQEMMETRAAAAGIEEGPYPQGPEEQEPEIIKEPRFPPPVAAFCPSSTMSSSSLSSPGSGPSSSSTCSRSNKKRRVDMTSLSLAVNIPEAVHFPTTGSFDVGSQSIGLGRNDSTSNSSPSTVERDGEEGAAAAAAAAAAGAFSAKVVVVTSGSNNGSQVPARVPVVVVPVVPPLTVSKNREREWRKGVFTNDTDGGGSRFTGKLRRWSWGIFAVKTADTVQAS